MNAKDGEYVDHKEHKLYDNRKSKLRIGTQSNNMMNTTKRKDNTSGITGVWWSKQHNMWVAEIMIENKKIHLGLFKDIKDAAEERKKAEEKYFGEWSYNNSTKIGEETK